MSGGSSCTAVFEPDPASVKEARRVFREVIDQEGAGPEIAADGALLVSELVTNVFVHAGTAAGLYVNARKTGVRVEVLDGGARQPARRGFALTAGTGRGLRMLEEIASRWGVEPYNGGKFVWFEIGEADPSVPDEDRWTPFTKFASQPVGPTRQVTLRAVPLLMHLAWQEHAATLLRELLLVRLRSTPESMSEHALASQAMNFLYDQLPALPLDHDPDLLMAGAVEPSVTADEVVLDVPVEVLDHFHTLERLLTKAITESREGNFLGPPTQPEMSELGEWFCAEVTRQGAGSNIARPWLARTDVRATLADQKVLTATYAELAQVDEPLLATDSASIIVAASPSALTILGYERADQLLGRRVIAVVPQRFHQAHIAGTTLHETNGRGNLLGVPVEVPMMRADGSEINVLIEVRKQPLNPTTRVFVARFRPAASPAHQPTAEPARP